MPDDHAPSRAIIMRFGCYEGAHAVLTAAGFVPTTDPANAPGRPDGPTVVRYAHPDGLVVVLAQQPVGG